MSTPYIERLRQKFPGCPLPDPDLRRWPRGTGAGLVHRFERGPRQVTRNGRTTKQEVWCWLLRPDTRPAKAIWARTWREAYQLAGNELQSPTAIPAVLPPLSGPAEFNPEHSATWRWADLVREYLRWKEKTGKTLPNTLNQYDQMIAKHLTPYFQGVLKDPLVSAIRPSQVTACLDRAEEKAQLSPRSYNKLRTLLSMMCTFAKAKDDTKTVSNPVEPTIHFRAEPERDVIALNEVQLQRLLESLKESCDPNLYPAAFLAGRAGLRLQEVAHVEGRDLEFTPAFDVVHVVSGRACNCLDCLSKITRKGAKKRPTSAVRRTKTVAGRRYVPLAPDLVQALREHQAALAAAGFDPMGRLFVVFGEQDAEGRRRGRGHGSQREPGDPISASELSVGVRIEEEVLGIAGELKERSPDTKRKPFHELRATARSRWSGRSGNTEQIAFAMGHALKGMAAEYTVAHKRECYETLEGAKQGQNQLGQRREQNEHKQPNRRNRKTGLLKAG